MHRQPHFKEQNDQQSITWVYGLLSNKPGNYIKKPIEQCTGQEITQELLYHLGVPEGKLNVFQKNRLPLFRFICRLSLLTLC